MIDDFNIKFILWDVDGTLLDFISAETVALRACFKDFGFGECTDSMKKEYEVINRKYWEALERGEITREILFPGRFEEFLSKYGLDTSRVNEFNELYQIHLSNNEEFFPKAEDTVRHFKGLYPQFAATNGPTATQKRKLAHSGLDKILDKFFISEEIGFDKPRKEFFEEIFNRVGDHNPANYVIIGDSLTSDMQGGINAGIKTCWYNPAGKANNSGLKIDAEIKTLTELYK
ncbi:MAG: YjjG family noncanonical pyrimidine nucleotidase [Lachnospiraceae bacterium]|nr:YjjG family noncanonical pyrimidine nucleotidase [Lachnospiraceae bacterium]